MTDNAGYVHPCCGCSCEVCEDGHQAGRHTQECHDRFFAEQDNASSRTFTACPVCGFQTLTHVHAAPGGDEDRCVVCDLRAENQLLRESRARIAAERNTSVGGDDE